MVKIKLKKRKKYNRIGIYPNAKTSRILAIMSNAKGQEKWISKEFNRWIQDKYDFLNYEDSDERTNQIKRNYYKLQLIELAEEEDNSKQDLEKKMNEIYRRRNIIATNLNKINESDSN